MQNSRGRASPELIREINRVYSTEKNKTEVARIVGCHRETVRRYIGSLQNSEIIVTANHTGLIGKSPVEAARSVAGDSVVSLAGGIVGFHPPICDYSQYRRIACLYDSHHPYHDTRAIRNIFSFLKDWKPDLFIFAGDTLDFYQISRFSKDPARSMGLQGEIDSLQPTLKQARELDCKVVWLDGNHEYRLRRHMTEHPGLFGLKALSIPSLLNFPIHWDYLEDQSRIKTGRLVIHHGDLQGKGISGRYPARAMLDKLRVSNLFGHLHREETAHVTEFDGSVSSCYCSGHMCDLSMVDYVVNPNWQQSFPIIEIDPDGLEHVTMKRIDKQGRVYHEGKVYG